MGIRAKGGSWEFRMQHQGQHYRAMLHGYSREEAEDFDREAAGYIREGAATPDYLADLLQPSEVPASAFFAAVVRARKRAAKKGRTFTLTNQDVEDLICRQCALTGIPFSLRKPAGATRFPFMPSLDRIDSAVGYERGNCRFVLWAVNNALGEWGEDTLRVVAAGVLFPGKIWPN